MPLVGTGRAVKAPPSRSQEHSALARKRVALVAIGPRLARLWLRLWATSDTLCREHGEGRAAMAGGVKTAHGVPPSAMGFDQRSSRSGTAAVDRASIDSPLVVRESGRARIMIGAHRIRADKTGPTGLRVKNGAHGIASSRTVRVGFGLRKTGLTGFRAKNGTHRIESSKTRYAWDSALEKQYTRDSDPKNGTHRIHVAVCCAWPIASRRAASCRLCWCASSPPLSSTPLVSVVGTLAARCIRRSDAPSTPRAI